LTPNNDDTIGSSMPSTRRTSNVSLASVVSNATNGAKRNHINTRERERERERERIYRHWSDQVHQRVATTEPIDEAIDEHCQTMLLLLLLLTVACIDRQIAAPAALLRKAIDLKCVLQVNRDVESNPVKTHLFRCR
jgi:hypothetical protein